MLSFRTRLVGYVSHIVAYTSRLRQRQHALVDHTRPPRLVLVAQFPRPDKPALAAVQPTYPVLGPVGATHHHFQILPAPVQGARPIGSSTSSIAVTGSSWRSGSRRRKR